MPDDPPTPLELEGRLRATAVLLARTAEPQRRQQLIEEYGVLVDALLIWRLAGVSTPAIEDLLRRDPQVAKRLRAFLQEQQDGMGSGQAGRLRSSDVTGDDGAGVDATGADREPPPRPRRRCERGVD